jgi:prepilin-type N-terminal cleavage/methylation domain-containing protein
MKSKYCSQSGITLIELLTTVVIIGIVTTMAVPRFQTAWERLKFKSTNRDIVSTLRLARSMAVSDKELYGVHFDGNAQVITLFKDMINTGTILFEAGDSVVRVDTLPQEFEYVATDLSNDVLAFQPNGSASFVGGGNIVTLAMTESIIGIAVHNVLSSTGRIQSYTSVY